ncbi:hypothetical protein EDB19DRAFT_203597 [Suillus lakei]|nr:hypothetical protein EDB19DRAFT_203597 [Suillus lakei]
MLQQRSLQPSCQALAFTTTGAPIASLAVKIRSTRSVIRAIQDMSDFACTLCKPMEGDISLVIHLGAVPILIQYLGTDLRELDCPQIALDQLVQQSIFPFDTSPTMLPTYARLDPGPDTQMELSAIPYLFCTPDLAFAPTPSGSSAFWMEGELTWTY